MIMKQLLLVLFLAFSSITIFAQQSNIGVRAGLNYSKLLGPLEQVEGFVGETHAFSNGFHFGLSYQYNFVDDIGLRFELLYIQNGSIKKYEGPSYYIVRNSNKTTFEKGESELFLDTSIGNLSIPITLHYKVHPKIEILAGVYASFSISPTANGALNFDSTDNPEDIFFSQSLFYRYYSDEPLEFEASGSGTPVFRGDEEIIIPRISKAYYQYTDAEVDGSPYKVIDVGLIAGANYYFNRGFYAGVRASYGLRDLTKNDQDFSISQFEIPTTLVTRDDKDTHFGLEVSLGFKF